MEARCFVDTEGSSREKLCNQQTIPRFEKKHVPYFRKIFEKLPEERCKEFTLNVEIKRIMEDLKLLMTERGHGRGLQEIIKHLEKNKYNEKCNHKNRKDSMHKTKFELLKANPKQLQVIGSLKTFFHFIGIKIKMRKEIENGSKAAEFLNEANEEMVKKLSKYKNLLKAQLIHNSKEWDKFKMLGSMWEDDVFKLLEEYLILENKNDFSCCDIFKFVLKKLEQMEKENDFHSESIPQKICFKNNNKFLHDQIQKLEILLLKHKEFVKKMKGESKQLVDECDTSVKKMGSLDALPRLEEHRKDMKEKLLRECVKKIKEMYFMIDREAKTLNLNMELCLRSLDNFKKQMENLIRIDAEHFIRKLELSDAFQKKESNELQEKQKNFSEQVEKLHTEKLEIEKKLKELTDHSECIVKEKELFQVAAQEMKLEVEKFHQSAEHDHLSKLTELQERLKTSESLKKVLQEELESIKVKFLEKNKLNENISRLLQDEIIKLQILETKLDELRVEKQQMANTIEDLKKTLAASRERIETLNQMIERGKECLSRILELEEIIRCLEKDNSNLRSYIDLLERKKLELESLLKLINLHRRTS